MRKSLLLTGFFALGLVAVAVAADFSGTWVINKEKSDVTKKGVPDITLTIKQNGNNLEVTTARDGDPGQVAKYTLDGKESRNPAVGGGDSPARGESVSKATVVGDTIAIETTADMGKGTTTTKAVYALSDGGKILTISTTRSDQSFKQVFDKK
jgi:hypothetical protein